MRATDLEHGELLELDPERGVIRFAGQRAILVDAVAVGLLRKYLVENFGLGAARAVLTQFGFAHGWRMADAIRAGFAGDDDADWGAAGARIHALGGLFHAAAKDDALRSDAGMVVVASFEAEQHILHAGRSDAPVCWTLCGVMSGYISRISGEEIYVLEDRCVGKGDPVCHFIGRTREQWGEERGPELRFFEPIRLQECLDVSLRRVTESLRAAEQKLRAHRRVLVTVMRDGDAATGIVAKSPLMRQVVDLARRVAPVDSTVLITGESGSGKERVARLVHDQSTRSTGPFIAVNCSAISEALLESELFGHARGAFTGASHDRPGLFEAAHSGTLLLDEVGDVSPAMQVKLLRTIQEREVRRVGENKSRKIDVRIVAATNRDLAAMTREGSFRRDLYYRLKVVELHVPPLRERREDLLVLARVLLGEAALRMKRKVTGLTPEAASQLLRYPWPGNVRELENAMERAVASTHGRRVGIEDLPDEVRETPLKTIAPGPPVRPLAEVEKGYILAALEANGGNQTHTARQLQIGTATLYRKLKRYGLIAGREKTSGSSGGTTGGN